MTGSDEAPIGFFATTTLDETIAAATHLQAAGKAPKKRPWRGPAFFFVVIAVGLGSGIVTSDDPIAAAKVLATTRFAADVLAIVLVISVMTWLSTLALRRVNRWATRRLYVDTRARHPAVDRADPTLALTRHYRFDETGMTTTTDFDEIWEAWPRITGMDETPDLLIVRIGGGTGYPLPKAQLAGELQERLHRFIAGRSHSKWPF